MSNEPTDTNSAVDTMDDLDAFTEMFEGRTETTKEEPVEPSEEVESAGEDEDQGTQEEVADDEAPDGEEESEETKEEPKKVNRFQERINELTAKAREAERALEALRAEQANKQNEAAKKPIPAVQHDDGPTPDDLNEDGSDKYPLGEFDPAYIRELARHTIGKEWEQKKQIEAQEQAQRQHQEARDMLQTQWVDKIATVEHEDFLDKTMELEDTFSGLDPEYSDYLVNTIKSLDHGPDVLYYFANHLDEAQKFVKMGALQATLALGEINSMFKGQTRKEAKVSKAPPPPQVNKGSKTRTSIAGDTDDLDAFADSFFQKKKGGG